jgi:prepilin-type N-terminal cleavage/methylation domain-containing protein
MNRHGFSLIEIMVATAILVVLVLLMSGIFHQSSVSWDAGTRKAQGNMVARAVLGFMARELSGAVAHDEIPLDANFISEGNSGHITFVTMGGESEPGSRIVKRVRYQVSGDSIKRWERTLDAPPNLDAGEYGRDMGQWYSGFTGQGTPLVTNVASLKFHAPPGGDGPGGEYRTRLPRWVKIELGINRTDDVSGVGARSSGPNHNLGDDDDITSW